MSQFPKPSALSQAITVALAGATIWAPAFAEETLPSVTITATSGAYRAEKDTASAAAPTQSSLYATQPQSVITREFIEQSVAPTAEYSRVVVIAPSLSGNSSNGPGLSETKIIMRGFGDDQYNITFDGIPWGDTNNPAHHSTSFFPASVIGGAVVERGPGNASNIGFATFGGSINLFSKKPSAERLTAVFGSIGNWNTQLYGISHETGKIAEWGDATVQLNVQNLTSDGYMTESGVKSDNVTLKFERKLGSDSVFTFFASTNYIKYFQNDNGNGPTLAQVAQFGKNYALNLDPTSFNFKDFNYTFKNTDFEYARIRTRWNDRTTSEATVYTYAYNNQTISSTTPTGLGVAGTKFGPTGNKDIPGIDKQNKYRVLGGIFKAERSFDLGLLRAGAWIEHSDTDRHQYDIDLTLNRARNPIESTAPFDVKFDQLSKIDSFQPFAEFEFEPMRGLLVTPGLKTVQITRSVDAMVNQTTRVPQNASVDYKTTLPFLTVNKQLAEGLAAYGQYAQGFQIPDLKSFYIADPTKNSSEPQLSTNYQIGIIGKSNKFVWDADLYQIDFKNKYVSNGLTGTAASYINIGGATYKGVEAQATYMVINGVALYANGSYNKATATDSGKQISGAPLMTAGLGVIYNSGPWGSSLIHKRTGVTYQKDFTPSAPNQAYYDFYRLHSYDNTDFGVSYNFGKVFSATKSTKLQLNIFNVFNQQRVTSISAGSSTAINSASDQYLFQAQRSFQVSGKFEF
jgi:iron complex outermembrane receptor protein